MDDRACLRCDWTGEAEGPACPRCGAPLYRLGLPVETPTPKVARPARSRPEPEERRRGSGGEWEEEEVDVPPAPAVRGRLRVIVVALTLAGASFAFALIRGGEPNLVDGAAPEGAVRAEPAASPGNAAPNPTTTPSPSATSDSCTEAPSPLVLTPAETVPAPTADYRFQDSLRSSAGSAPDLIEIGKGQTTFTDEGAIGRTVLSFAERAGLSLSPTSGVVSRTEYTIEILFRLDDVGGYRKIVDVKNGSRDGGLYVLDGCLNFFPKPFRYSTPIETYTYAQVVLTRGSSDAVVGYVNGVRQFVFDDELGIAEIGPARTLRFFIDDSRTKVEHSSGAVSQIRLYDRALSADEVARLACSEIRVPIATTGCPAT